MVYVKIIILFILSMSHQSAYSGVECISDGVISPYFFTDKNERIEIVDFKYTPPFYLDEILSCHNYSNSSNVKVSKSSISLLVGAKNWRVGRLKGETKVNLYRSCLASSSCNIRWPYIISTPELWLQWIQKKYESKNDCHQEKQSTKLNNSSPLSSTGYLDIQQTKWWEMPRTDIVKLTLEEAEKSDYKKIIISGMTASLDSLKELSEIASRKNIQVEIYLDHQLNTIKKGFINRALKMKPNLKFILIPRTPWRAYSFHFKGVLFLDSKKTKNKFFWVSPNWFRVQDHTKLTDVGFETTDSDVVAKIYNSLNEYQKNLCSQERKWTRCLVDEKSSDFKRKKKEYQLLAIGCESDSNNLIVHKNKVVRYSESEMFKELKIWLMDSKKTVDVHTHVFTGGKFLDFLAELVESGKLVKLRIGKPVSLGLANKIKSLGIDFYVENRPNSETHSKFIIRDNLEAFITSGNFTDTGLSNTTETGFMTNDPTAIKMLQNLYYLK